MGEPLVIIIEYDFLPNGDIPLSEAIEQIRREIHITDHRQLKFIQIHAAIREDAQRVLSVFD